MLNRPRDAGTTAEAGLETVQESVTMGGVQLGSRLDTGQDAYSFKEMVDRLLGTATNALATYTLTSLPASVHNIGTARSRLAAEGEARLLAGEMPTEEQLWAYRNKHVAPAAGVCDPPQRGIQRAEHPPAGL